MTRAIVGLTFRLVGGRRRILLVAMLALLPVVVAILVGSGRTGGEGVRAAATLLDALVVRSVLPLVALIVGTAAIGGELEDGTAVHLLTKPVARWRIVLAKIAVASAVTAGLIVPATLAAGLAAAGLERGGDLVRGYVIGVGLGAVLYPTLFVALSIVTARALIVGLLYTLIWEGVVAGLFEGTRILSVRQHVLAVAEAAAGPSGVRVPGALEVETAVLAALAALVGAFIVAVWRLARWEVHGTT